MTCFKSVFIVYLDTLKQSSDVCIIVFLAEAYLQHNMLKLTAHINISKNKIEMK